MQLVHHQLVGHSRSQWKRSIARWWKGTAFTEKMNAEHEDEEFVGLRVSGHTMQNNDPPPEFTGTKPSEFKSYREKVRRWLLFTRTPAQLQKPRVLSRLTGPAWDACDELEPEDVATADGVHMILDTLTEAFQGEHDVDGSHTAYVSQAKEALVEQEEDIDVETALAALELESDTDLEETDVQEIPLAYKESRQLRGEQRVNCDQEFGVCSDDVSCQPNVDCEWGEWHEWNGCSVTLRYVTSPVLSSLLLSCL